jgi:hypothetical protein
MRLAHSCRSRLETKNPRADTSTKKGRTGQKKVSYSAGKLLDEPKGQGAMRLCRSTYFLAATT